MSKILRDRLKNNNRGEDEGRGGHIKKARFFLIAFSSTIFIKVPVRDKGALSDNI